jgi:hypothetical protein
MAETRKTSNPEFRTSFPLAFGLASMVMYAVRATESASRIRPVTLPSRP